jgi:hypothetical protein
MLEMIMDEHYRFEAEQPILKTISEHDAGQPTSALKSQVGGDHYRNCKLQPIEYIEANDLRFLEGSVVKRVTRHDKPTGKGKQDIEKAIHELQLLLELRYGDEG